MPNITYTQRIIYLCATSVLFLSARSRSRSRGVVVDKLHTDLGMELRIIATHIAGQEGVRVGVAATNEHARLIEHAKSFRMRQQWQRQQHRVLHGRIRQNAATFITSFMSAMPRPPPPAVPPAARPLALPHASDVFKRRLECAYFKCLCRSSVSGWVCMCE